MLFDHRLRFISAIAEMRKYQIYSEYAPYTYIEDLKEFIDKVAQMNRVTPVFRKH